MVSNENIADDLNRCLPERTPAKTWLEKHLLEKKEAAQEISATLMKHYWLCLLQSPPSDPSPPSRVAKLVDLLIPVHPWLASRASAQGSPVHMECCQLPTITLINTRKGQLCTCSSPCERPSPRPDSPESSTCDKFSQRVWSNASQLCAAATDV